MKPQTTPIKSAENPIERLQNLKVNVKSNSNISVSFSCGFLEEKSLNDVREIALDFASLQTTAKEKEFCERLESLNQKVKKLEFMIDNGLGWDDVKNDISMPPNS